MARADTGRPRRWRRRLLWASAIVLFLLLVVRVGGVLLLPTVLDRVAGSYRMRCEYEHLGLALWRGDAELWNLRLLPEEGGTPYVVAEYCGLDVSTLELLRGRLVVRRLEADGLDLNLERGPSGEFELFQRLASSSAPEEPAAAAAGDRAAAPPEPAREPEPANLAPPLRVDAFRLQHVQLHYRDLSGAEPLVLDAEANLRVSEIAAGAPARIELTLSALPGPVFLRLDGSVQLDPARLAGSFRLRGSMLRSPELREILAPVGLDLAAQTWTIGADLEFQGQAAGPENAQLAGEVRLADLSVEGDGRPLVELASVSAECDDLRAPRLVVPLVAVRDGRVVLERTDAGLLRVAGFELRGGAAESTEPPPDEEPAAEPRALLVHRVAVEGIEARFVDRALAEPTELSAGVELAEVKDLALPLSEPARFDVRLRAPGVLEGLACTGTLEPVPEGLSLAAECNGTGVTLKELSPYLQAAGLESTLEDGTLYVELNALLEEGAGGSRVSAAVAPLDLSSAAGEHLHLGEARITGLSAGSEDGLLSVASVEVTGLVANVTRSEEGALAFLGLRTLASAPAPLAAPPEERSVAGAAPPTSASSLLPAVRLEQAMVRDVRLRFHDARAPEPLEVECGLEARHWTLGSAADPEAPGTLAAELRIDGVLEKLAVQGSLRSTKERLEVELTTEARGISAARLAPLLAGSGLELAVDDGTLRFSAQARVEESAAGLVVAAGVKDLEFANDGRPLLSLASAAVEELTLGPALRLGSVSVVGPRLALSRDAAGVLHGPGFLLRPAEPGAPPAAPPEPEPRPEAPVTAAGAAPLEIGAVTWEGLEIGWTDAAADPPVSTTMSLALSGADLVPGRAAAFTAEVRVQDALDVLKFEGSLESQPQGMELRATLTAEGLRAGPFAAYLPPGTEAELEDAALALRLRAAATDHAEGGRALRAELSDFALRDGTTEWLAFRELVAAADRVDPDAGVFALQELALRGLRAEVHQEGAAVVALGIRKSPVAQPEPDVSEPAAPDAAPASPPLTEVSLHTLELGVERVVFRRAEEGAQPLALENLVLRNDAPIHAGTAFDETPVKVELSATAPPVLDRFHLALEAEPFAPEPHFRVSLEATGLRGAGIAAVRPSLAPRVDTTTLVDGKVSAALEGTLRLRRNGPLDYSLADGFGGELTVAGVRFEDVAMGMVWAGLDSLQVEARSILPQSGSASFAHIVLERPLFHAWRDAEGLHALGVLWKQGPPQNAGEQEANGSALAEANGEDAGAPSGATGPILRIDALEVFGIDFWVENRSTTPSLYLPIEDLFLNVRGFSTAPGSPGPLRFQFLAVGGPMAPPAEATQAEQAASPAAPRFFDEIACNGQLVLGDSPSGWLRARVGGFFLPGLKGVAGSAGVTVEDGLLDSTVHLRLEPDGGLRVDSEFRFTDLSLSEPSDGPISRFLKLPAPLDQVLFALRDPSGGIDIPLDLEVGAGGISATRVTQVAVATLGSLLAQALAQAPLRVVSGIGGFMDRGGTEPEETRVDVLEFPFATGSMLPSTEVEEQLRRLRLRLQDDPSLAVRLRHEIGERDQEIEQERMNPDPEELAELRSYFQQRKQSLEAERIALALAARAAFETGTEAEAEEARHRVQEVERRIGITERDLDYVLGLGTRDNERQRDRRTRSASLDLALGRVEQAILGLNPSSDARMSERIRAASPRAWKTVRPGPGCVVVELYRR